MVMKTAFVDRPYEFDKINVILAIIYGRPATRVTSVIKSDFWVNILYDFGKFKNKIDV